MKADVKLKINRQKIRSRAFTLAEMLVAVSITVIMLLIIGLVFSSSIKATGIGASSNSVMGQLQTLTGQLEKDFSGWRHDMPMAIIFEGYKFDSSNPNDPRNPGDPDEWGKLVHYDRICGFANGDFQDMYGTASGNVARIFYGQMVDNPLLGEFSDVAPPRQILSRRYKILTAVDPERYKNASFSSVPLNLLNWPIAITPESYDGHLFEEASVQLWKNQIDTAYFNFFFNTAATESFVRSPKYDDIIATGNYQWLQQLYLLPDVTDFKIQIWVMEEIFGLPGEYKGRWFPNDYDLDKFWGYAGGNSSDLYRKFAIYWNTPQLSGSPTIIDNIPWFSPLNCQSYYFADTGFNLLVGNVPAVKFTFTLYDQGRKNFPQGQTFEYIVKLGQ
ncbi:MAG: type II secretion system protein [Sedimentisphaerales bacterium]|nr:type II secretion system protein [Sedimentisphaerales bacterium]